MSLKNFLSYGAVPTVINLDRPGTTLILGEDMDNTDRGVGANGVGKDQRLDCKVKTPAGWTTIGETYVGQTISMPDGTTADITGVFPQGAKQTYKVTFADGRHTYAGAGHLWSVFSHRWGKSGVRGEKIVTTLELIQYLKECEERNNKPWYRIFVPTISHPEMPDADVPINPYLLGVLLGDGGISTPNIKITSADLTLIDECSNILNEEFHGCELRLETYEYSNGYDYVVTNPANMRERLKQLELLGTKSNTKFIPTEYLEGTSKEQKLALLAGLLDTDGTVGKTKNVSLCSVSEQLAKDVQYLVRSIGGQATITTRNPHYINEAGEKIQGQLAYNVSIKYKSPRELFHLERKKELLSEGETQYASQGLRVASVELDEVTETQCIMVDHPDHQYITDDFIVTHNTVIINGLVYALYDKPISNISKDNLVNNINKKHMEVTLDFQISDDVYRIRRARKQKVGASGNWVKLYKNNTDITPDCVSNTNNEIEKIIGLPFDLFVRIVAVSANHTPFLDLPVRHPTSANQTDIIEELFDLKTLSEKASALKDEIKSVELNISGHEQRIAVLVKEHEQHQKLIDSAEKRVVNWQINHEGDIKKVEAKLAKLAGINVEAERAAYEELKELNEKLVVATKELKSTNRIITTLKKQIADAKRELSHLDSGDCPYCLQKYAEAHNKAAELNIQISADETTLSSELKKGEIEEALVDELDQKAQELQSMITVGTVDELYNIRGKISGYEKQLADLRKAENPHIEGLDELEAVELEDIDMTTINELKVLTDHQRFLLKLLTKKDSFVRKALLNKNIPFLNTRLAGYLLDLGLPHTVEFTHEMTASISQFGRAMDFGNLSNGQRARVNLALSFAFRDVLQSIHQRVNVCMLDEVLDVGLDAVGVQSAAKMLKHKAREEDISLYIISHRDEIDNAFDRTMTIQMSKGFSYLGEESE